jgi:predicted acyltransferase (DUF342 family)
MGRARKRLYGVERVNIFSRKNLIHFLEELGADDLGSKLWYGDATVKQDLYVEGNLIGGNVLTAGATEAQDFHVWLDLIVQRDSTVKGQLRVDGGIANQLPGILEVYDLHVYDHATVHGDSTVKGEFRVEQYSHFSGNVHVSGEIKVATDTTIKGELRAEGRSDLQNVDIYQNLFIRRDATAKGNFHADKLYAVEIDIEEGPLHFEAGDAVVNNDAWIRENLRVQKDATIRDKIRVQSGSSHLGTWASIGDLGVGAQGGDPDIAFAIESRSVQNDSRDTPYGLFISQSIGHSTYTGGGTGLNILQTYSPTWGNANINTLRGVTVSTALGSNQRDTFVQNWNAGLFYPYWVGDDCTAHTAVGVDIQWWDFGAAKARVSGEYVGLRITDMPPISRVEGGRQYAIMTGNDRVLFGGDTTVKGDLIVENRLKVSFDTLSVEQDLLVRDDATIKGNLVLDGCLQLASGDFAIDQDMTAKGNIYAEEGYYTHNAASGETKRGITMDTTFPGGLVMSVTNGIVTRWGYRGGS